MRSSREESPAVSHVLRDFGQSRGSTRWTDRARAVLATIHAGVIGDRKASRALTGTAEMLQARLHLRPRSCATINNLIIRIPPRLAAFERGRWEVRACVCTYRRLTKRIFNSFNKLTWRFTRKKGKEIYLSKSRAQDEKWGASWICLILRWWI